ncbi:MAG: lipoyl domain-containing protein [Gemmataceae bacterium]|nr:lipoyl domain-containing protein [Gemmataceae bacterium]
MNAVPIVLPDLGSPNCHFSLWLVRPGERVREGDRVAEIVFPGAVVDLSAPADGTLRERLARPGDSVVAGQTIGTLELADS